MAVETIVRGIASRLLPQASPDNAREGLACRINRYGDNIVNSLVPTKHLLADEGSFFVVTNPTPGTGIALNANVTAFSDTNALFVVGNIENPANQNAKRIFLDELRLLLLATAPTGTVSMEFALKKSMFSREPVTAANRTLLTPVNMSSGSGRGSIGRYLSYAAAGAMTVPASSPSDPVVCRARIPTGLGIAGDEYVLKFGGEDLAAFQGGAAVRATDVARRCTTAPPVMIEPGEWLAIHMWWLTAATTAASFEFQLSGWER